MISISTIENLNKVITEVGFGKTFYASDVGLSGGAMAGLSRHGLIKPTGRTKETWYQVDDETMKKGEIKEWMLANEPASSFMWNLYLMKGTAEMIETICENYHGVGVFIGVM